mmetsp:Transcript_41385/g.89714  ORF Transcript_41385/g.89714 Transcript_41385/m.89714 type:complete len:97 (-) Transcript_41385:278-568(-)
MYDGGLRRVSSEPVSQQRARLKAHSSLESLKEVLDMYSAHGLPLAEPYFHRWTSFAMTIRDRGLTGKMLISVGSLAAGTEAFCSHFSNQQGYQPAI